MTFEQRLETAHIGERMVADFLKATGCGIVPSYDYSGKHGEKAPRLMFEHRSLVIPDLDVCKPGGGIGRFWCEVKTYYRAAYNRSMAADVHGIESRLYRDYLMVEADTATPVFICVLEVSTGATLVARLRGLHVEKCMCGGCRHGGSCWAFRAFDGIRAGVYWKRACMTLRHEFTDPEMRELRSVWPIPRGAAEATR